MGTTQAPADEYITYWFIGDTWGTYGYKDRQPRSWACAVVQ
jgi:hypothetical protein